MGSRCPLFAVLALSLSLTLATPAAAGPIDFSYRVYGEITGPGSVLDPGPVTFSLDPGGNISWQGRGGSLELGSVRFGSAPGPQAADSYTAGTNFRVSAVVTDQMTGQSVALSLPGGAVDEWTFRSWDGRWANSFHRLDLGDWYPGGVSETSAVIGHARYTLAVHPQDDGQAGVYTLTATVTNPEPGTLALGLIALAPLGLRAVRRNRR